MIGGATVTWFLVFPVLERRRGLVRANPDNNSNFVRVILATLCSTLSTRQN